MFSLTEMKTRIPSRPDGAVMASSLYVFNGMYWFGVEDDEEEEVEGERVEEVYEEEKEGEEGGKGEREGADEVAFSEEGDEVGAADEEEEGAAEGGGEGDGYSYVVPSTTELLSIEIDLK